MIIVNFPANTEIITAGEHLYQWDNGQKIQISGLDGIVSSLTTINVHFANKVCEMALTVTPTVSGKTIIAPIPNSLLQYEHPIIAYIYIPSDDGGRTIKMVTIPVEGRKRPNEFELDEDEAITSLEIINNKVNAVINTIHSDYNKFKIDIEAELNEIANNLQIGDADTVDGKHASDFFQNLQNWVTGHVKQRTLYSVSGVMIIEPGVTGMPVNDCTWHGICTCTRDGRSIIVTRIDTGDTYTMSYKSATDTWSNWSILNGGDADTVDGKHASDFVQVAVAQDVPGLKRFGNQVIVKSATTKGTTPNNATYGQLVFTDSTGNIGSSGLLGIVYQETDVNNNSKLTLCPVSATENGSDRCRLSLVENANGEKYAVIDPPTNANRTSLRNMSAGIAAASASNCPTGAWYGQYE